MSDPPHDLAALDRAQRDALRELLLACLTTDEQRSPDRLPRALRAAPVELLPAAAALHRVSGAVLRGLDGVAGVPDVVRQHLTAATRQATMRHLLYSAFLTRIGAGFDGAGLTWLAMKGPVVARLYPDPGDRAYGDLDVLVDRRHFPDAVGILEAMGFGHVIHNWALAEHMLAGQIELSTGGVAIDAHWHLHYSRADRHSYQLDPDAMLSRARRVEVAGAAVPTFDAVDTVMALGFHAARSGGHRLMWLKDIERAVAVDEPDLDELVERCRQARCGPPVGLILGRAQRLLGARVPDRIIHDLVPASLRATERTACAIVDPVPLDDDDSLTRWFTRSVRSTARQTIAEVPWRLARAAYVRVRPPAEHETDDPSELASYYRAVVSAAE